MSSIAVYHGPKNISADKVAAALQRLAIPFEIVTPSDIARGRLAGFTAVIFPGGHSVRLSAIAIAHTRGFVRAGGGLLGICAGAQFGAAIHLLQVRHHVLRARGTFDMRVIAPHPVTASYQVAGPHPSRMPWRYSNRGRIRIRYANGGFYRAGRGVRVLVSLDESGQLAAVVAGSFGRGRVVLSTPHPESTPADENRHADSAKSQDPLRLFANAVRYIAGTPGAPRTRTT